MPAPTIELLRDEAYLALAREALREQLDRLARDKAIVAGTRPPFGVLARKETRDTFTRSMRTVEDNEASTHALLAQVEAIEAKLLPQVQRAVAAYLADQSPGYLQVQQGGARLEDWGRALQGLPELLLGFARDVRSVRLAIAAGEDGMRELAALREIALRLEQHDRELLVIEQAFEEVAAGLGAVKLPSLPDFHRVGWVARLGALSREQVVQETTRVEAEIRQFLAEGAEVALARWEASRAECSQHERHFLESYWRQLRAHAQMHYIEEEEIEPVLARLNARYIEPEIVRRQQELAFDPLVERRRY